MPTRQDFNTIDLMKNQFDFTNPLSGFVDKHSHMVFTVSRNFIGIDAISPRGLVNNRDIITSPSLKLKVKAQEWDFFIPIAVTETTTYPWKCLQKALCTTNKQLIYASSILTCPEYNVYVLEISLSTNSPLLKDVSLEFEGQFVHDFTKILLKEVNGSVIFSVQQADMRNDTFYNTRPDFVPCWRISIKDYHLSINRCGLLYFISAGIIELSSPVKLQIVFEMENRPPEKMETWPGLPNLYNIEKEIERSKTEWEDKLVKIPGQERPTYMRELRAAAVLTRCGYRGRNGNWGDMVANFCMITSWASTAFFWDSVFGALGLAEFDLHQAEDALRILFTYQRSDGCVPTGAYEHMVGSTFYPQAPLVSWAVLRIFSMHNNIDFVQEILPRMRGVFEWYSQIQDHDGDGLLEVRFSGSLADNAPQYDRYISHVNPHPEVWNIFLPPIASVALNSFFYMDARCLATLYKLINDPNEAQIVMEKVKDIPRLMQEICWDKETKYFHDYDHQVRCFNRARVLTSILPLWAGMPLDKEKQKILIKENLLNENRFYGEYPFPYLAYDDPAYTPQGYWRGRIWPHTTTWMLELLWRLGYHTEADNAASRLLNMMNQREEILENYYSNPSIKGGGSLGYNWSNASYLYIANRRYRELPYLVEMES